MTSAGAATAPKSSKQLRPTVGDRLVVAFICENAGRAGAVPSSGLRRRPSLPDFRWPFPVRQIAVPCSGRLQPEHFLKALEDGADLVTAVCCDEGNCHHAEGSRRCQRRIEYVRELARAAGLPGERLLLAHLPGSAAEDMALGVGTVPRANPSLPAKLADLRDAVAARLATLPPSPLGKGALPDESPYEVDDDDESDE
jgi:F420-non-reducing hydrogenase iron-sulfur subunit